MLSRCEPAGRFLLPLLLFCPSLPAGSIQGGDGALARLKLLQEKRAALIAKVSPAVCAVMSLSRPGGGSGVVFHPRGWILTNFHVTGRNKVMKIGLPDGKFYLADVVGIDPGGDISVCALRGKGPLEGGLWPSVRLGDSDKLRLGGFAYAMGNPFLLATDFKPTVTMGVISGIHRFQKGTGPNGRMLVYPDCIQVDAPVNPGNSGGPLFDENGLLVGINGRITIRDRGRVNTGIGFAVSINQIRRFLPDLLAGKHAEHGTMDLNAWYMEDPNLGRGRMGVFVQGILEDSIAAKHGVRLGDMLVSFNGDPIRTANQLGKQVGSMPAGFIVELGFRRFLERTRSYGPVRFARFPLAPLDTGSKRNDRPNVPDFRKRPDFERLLAEQKARAARKKAKKLTLADLLVPKGRKLPKEWEKGLPRDWRRRIPKEWRGKVKVKGSDEKPPRDLVRERALFDFMDGVVAELRSRLKGTLPPYDPSKGRRFAVEVLRVRKGLRRPLGERRYLLEGDSLRYEGGGKVRDLSALDPDEVDERTSLERERDLVPFLRPDRALEALEDSWLEGGAWIGKGVVWVLALRGPGKRAVYLDQETFVPVGCRYRSPAERGLVEWQVRSWRRKGAEMRPEIAEKRIDGRLVEILQFPEQGDAPVFRAFREAPKPLPKASVEARLDPLFSSVVKINGASGVRGIEGYGTGLVCSKEGHILTWNHIMLQPGQIKVTLRDGSVHEARIVRKQEELGVAMLKIDPRGKESLLEPLSFPEKEGFAPTGTFVFSIGNANKLAEFEERLSVTMGVVVGVVSSDLRLNLRNFPYKGRVYLLDAPSNPGTQGGGVFTQDGRLLGLLAPLVESRETNTQLFLAIPSHALSSFVAWCLGDKKLARRIEEGRRDREAHGKVFHGIVLFDTGRRRSPPAYIDRVLPRSPAREAGLRPDDLIVRIDDFPVRTCAEFRRVLRHYAPGTSVDVTFKRGARVMKVSMKLTEDRR